MAYSPNTTSNQKNQRTMKPEVVKIFDDLEAWLDHCRFNLLNFNPADLYKSKEYKDFQRKQAGGTYERKPYLGKNPRNPSHRTNR